MTKFFIAVLIGCGFMIPNNAFAVSSEKPGAKQEVKKDAKKKLIKKVSVKEKKPKRQVVSLDFEQKEKRSVHFKNVQMVKAQNLPKKSQALVPKRKLASVTKTPINKLAPQSRAKPVIKTVAKPVQNASGKPMTVAQLKKSTKPYWAAYCKDGIVLNSHVYCALKNPQKMGLKASKQTRMASSRDLEAKKRK